tara:strand:- start:314 stop:649 length:336 start_codon:yes stop_codon:yes gene_type:complete
MTKKIDIKNTVENSLLISAENKANLLRVLPKLDQNQVDELAELLVNIDETNQGMLSKTLEEAVAKNDTGFLKKVDELVAYASKILRKGEEKVDVDEDKDKLTDLESLINTS